MKTKLKYFGIISLLLVFSLTVAGCSLVQEKIIEPETFNSTVRIENIEEAEHGGAFTLSEDFEDSSVTFTDGDVEEGVISHTFGDLEGEVEISLAIDNEALPGGYYEEVEPVTVDADDPDAAFELEWVAVDPEATSVTLSGETEVYSYYEEVTETYTAALDVAIAGVPVTLAHDADEDLVSIEENVQETNEAGEAGFEVSFAAEQEFEVVLTALIDEADEGVAESASDALVITVNTAQIPSGNIVSVEDLSPLNVEFGTEFGDLDLPEEVEVTLDDENESTFMVKVDWDEGDYDGQEAGSYTLEGELVDLPEGITNTDDVRAEIEVIVADPPLDPVEFTVSPESLEMYENETVQLTVDVTVPDENYTIEFVSQNENIATVDANGLVTAVSEGTTSIAVTVDADDYQAVSKSVNVTVEDDDDRIIIEPSNY